MTIGPNKVQPLTPFGTFMGATPVLPSLYWDVYSAEQRWKAISKLLKKLCDYIGYMGDEINVDRDTLNRLVEDFEKFKESGFIDYYEEQINQWISENLPTILKSVLQGGVYFGLDENGYFMAYIADQLLLDFDTIADYSDDAYGRLVIKY